MNKVQEIFWPNNQFMGIKRTTVYLNIYSCHMNQRTTPRIARKFQSPQPKNRPLQFSKSCRWLNRLQSFLNINLWAANLNFKWKFWERKKIDPLSWIWFFSRLFFQDARISHIRWKFCRWAGFHVNIVSS